MNEAEEYLKLIQEQGLSIKQVHRTRSDALPTREVRVKRVWGWQAAPTARTKGFEELDPLNRAKGYANGFHDPRYGAGGELMSISSPFPSSFVTNAIGDENDLVLYLRHLHPYIALEKWRQDEKFMDNQYDEADWG